MSYSQIEEIDTALCLHKLARRNEDGVALPEFIQQFIQASCAWENIDRLEETLSGGGTSHRVNGIIVQKKMFGPEPQRRFPNQPRDKGRTVKFVEADLPIYIYIMLPVLHYCFEAVLGTPESVPLLSERLGPQVFL